MHNFWSRDWVDDLYSKPDDPLLGDVTPKKGRKWFNGVPPVPLPPLLADGCSTGIPVEQRCLIGGFDSRCWLAAGFPVPDNVPVLWLRYDSFKEQAANGQPPSWKDKSSYKEDAVMAVTPQVPLLVDFGDFQAVACSNLAAMQQGETIDLCPQWTCFVVMYVPTLSSIYPSNVRMLASFHLEGLLIVNQNNMQSITETQGVTFATDDNGNQFIVWSVRRNLNVYNAWRNNVDLGVRGNNTSRRIHSIGITTPLATYPSGGGGPPIARRALLFEVRLFNCSISDAQFDAVRTELLAYYASLLPTVEYFPETYFTREYFPGGYFP